MCTVSFVTSNQKIIITSNRDEQVIRPSIEPKYYLVNTKKILFPKDPKAGGTWFAIDEEANILVLLNGAEEKHLIMKPYRRSRGLILLDIISQVSPIDTWELIDLDNIEPFTLVSYQSKMLYQLRWDGSHKKKINLDPNKNHIWSSSTLYPLEVREERAKWFSQYIYSKIETSAAEILDFHRYTEGKNQEHGLVINRNNTLKTLSITQVEIDRNKITTKYVDLIQQQEFISSFLII